MALLEVKHISKRFKRHQALNDVNFSLEKGRILCLLGPSGCGKTTLLRIIAGLEKEDSGHIHFAGRDVKQIPVHQRQFRMMFQEFALFPHKNVFDNVAFGLQMQNLATDEIYQRTRAMLTLVGLDGFDTRDINDLSGGERQRVALARSLAPDPQLLMLDEPLGFLDRRLRKRLLMDLNRILHKIDITTIFVTHDQAEAFALADHVAVMQSGRILQVDRPEALYHKPSNPDVASFLGFQNLFTGRGVAKGRLQTPLGEFDISDDSLSVGEKVAFLVRPEGARLVPSSTGPEKRENIIEGRVIDRLFQGHFYHVRMLTEPGYVLEWDLPADYSPPEIDQLIRLVIKPTAIVLLRP